MVRLTAELVEGAVTWINPLKERELKLRGLRIGAIENIGVAGGIDAIDFVDNDIQLLGNFPLSPRITTLLLANNRISAISPTLGDTIPNIKNLAMANNNLTELADLDPLKKCKKLHIVAFGGNPITKKENYRYWVLWKAPSIRILDYQKVKQVEREKALELFGTEDEPTELAQTIMSQKSESLPIATANGSASNSKLSRIKLTESEKAKLQERILNASTLQEVLALEKELSEGRLPTGLGEDDVKMDEA